MNEDGDAGAEAKKIHPFFSTPKNIAPDIPLTNSVRPVTPDPSCSPSSDKTFEKPAASAVTAVDEFEPTQGRKKRRKTDSGEDVKLPAKRGRPKGTGKATVSTSESVSHLRKKDNGAPMKTDDDKLEPTQENVNIEAHHVAGQSPPVQAPLLVSNPEQTPTQRVDEQPQESRPKRLLKFNPKTGTIGSPPKPKVQTIDEAIPKPKSTAKSKGNKKATCLVVCVSYGIDSAARVRIGEKIEAILSGVRYAPTWNSISAASQSKIQQTTPPTSSQETPKKRGAKKSSTSKKAKTAHPFFTSKSKTAGALDPAGIQQRPKSPSKRQSIFTSTPCSPKHNRQHPAKFNFPQFAMKAGGFKFPGAKHAAWPWSGMVHVHGDERDGDSINQHRLSWTDCQGRKSKGRQIEFPTEESVLNQVEMCLQLDKLAEEFRALDTEDFLPTPPTLRVPERFFESGKLLQARVQPELRTFLPGNPANSHPAIIDGFKSLATSLAAFDRSTCENTAWAQKYGPVKASHVLQVGKEAELLRDWLQTLKVQTVDTGTSDNVTNPKLVTKKKKRKKLNDFIVSSDEEETLMDEVSEDESAWLPNTNQGSSKRTVVRGRSSKDTRLTNAVLLSGPHGCGKTATVYAIARELDFEVFEISPGARRNGKDIIEKIGDMTRNHQVSHKQETSKHDDTINEEEVARDIKSGKQGMMTAFFQPKADAKPAAAKINCAKEPEKILPEKQAKKTSNTNHKQSLILLEEVDILYEEDKQFWTTVIGLMVQSKRPFIMTCNNETLVPLQSLNLHGIFRFSTSPKDLAVDHLLLIAANEGHALKREAVEALYESRGSDLRASIAELNYWCQIGIGDPKGGFGWFYPKWPKGSDQDERGDRIRAVSSGTYLTGMGWLGRDAVSNSTTSSRVEDEIIQQAWESWALDSAECERAPRRQESAMTSSFAELPRNDRLSQLDAADSYYDTLSAADIISFGTFSSPDQLALDATLPNLPSKVKEDFVIGLRFLDAPTLSRYDTTTFKLGTSIRNLARVHLSHPQLSAPIDCQPLNEIAAIREIQASFTRPSPNQPAVTRYDFSLAFDPIAASEKSPLQSLNHLEPSVFDRTMKMITLDVAPYVRSIVAYDQRLQGERLFRSNLLSEGGNPKKRMRSTRSAYSALEGGSRASTRREKYFSAELNPHLVMRTGGSGWETLACDQHAYDLQTPSEEQTSPCTSMMSVDGMNTPVVFASAEAWSI